jgi:nucleotide-binding universal stress UspA family protein
MKIERILCPLDLSRDSDEALRYAFALARAYEARLILFHCFSSAAAGSNGKVDVARDQERIKFQRLLEEFAGQRLDASELVTIHCDAIVAAGDDFGDAIATQASRLGADLIVMRSRRRPHRAALLGSTAESVCRTAPCPVLVMHSDERDWVNDPGHKIELKRVLVAYDFSDHSELALNYGLSFAQEYQAELHLLHVLPAFTVNEPEISWYPMGKEGTYHKAARSLQRAVPPEAHLWCHITHAVSEGQPYREILTYAEKNQIDLICLGAHGAGFGMRALFGSNVDRVLRQAPCPVLVARPLKHAKSFHAKSVLAEIDGMRLVRKSNKTVAPKFASNGAR